ncbi:MAG: metal-sulfur cluster assembly factor [Armatimonadota bacterium]|nr:metal-sulfur cluster assembly factor [Armatimonadota bacterium]
MTQPVVHDRANDWADAGALSEPLIREAPRAVIDPELGWSIVDLNMVRRIDVADRRVTVHLVLTIPGCPLVGWIVQSARQVIASLPGVEHVEVVLLDEPWQPPDRLG